MKLHIDMVTGGIITLKRGFSEKEGMIVPLMFNPHAD